MSIAARPISCFKRSPLSSSNLSHFICAQCRHRARLQAHSRTSRGPASIFLRSASSSGSKLPYTEKLRRKIWGTDNPPGQADPYGGPGILERQQNRDDDAIESKDFEESEEFDHDSVSQEAAADYVPATTWDGLSTIGGESGWWEADWDREHVFQGFMSSTTESISDTAAPSRLVRKALLEVFTLKEMGKPLSDVTHLNREISPHSSTIGFLKASDGSFSLNYPDEQTRQNHLDTMTREEEPEPEVELDNSQESSEGIEQGEVFNTNPVQAGELPATEDLEEELATLQVTEDIDVTEDSDSTWLKASLYDPGVKFAVFKRVMQLTGKRISDPVIQETRTAEALVSHLSQKPKPTKVAHILSDIQELSSLPNVRLYSHRYGKVQKEMEVGRWKVIEKELIKRGLSVRRDRLVT